MKTAEFQSLAIVDTCNHYLVTIEGFEPKQIKLGHNLMFQLEIELYFKRLKKEIAEAFALKDWEFEIKDVTPEFPLPCGPHEGHSSFRPGGGYED